MLNGSSPNEVDGIATPGKNETIWAYSELERAVYAALETYANVHRGSGHKSIASTHLFEQARDIILDYLGLNRNKYVVIFCSPRGASMLTAKIENEDYKILSSADIGLPLGVRALAVNKKRLPKGAPFQAGGGTARLVSPGWVIWDNAPDKFEPGTPSVINVIAFAKAICLIRQYGNRIFFNPVPENLTVADILHHDDLDGYSGAELLEKLRLSQIGIRLSVPTAEGISPYINLDNSASTPAFTAIWETVRRTWHQSDELRKEIVNDVRNICAEATGASLDNYDLIFTSNATEAINLAAENFASQPWQDTEPVVLTTLLEHTSNDLPWRMVQHASLIRLDVNAEGFLDLKMLDTIFSEYNKSCQHGKKRIKLMALSGASNVLGSLNDLEEISRIVHNYGAYLLVDGAQLVAHRKVEMGKWGIDYLAFSAHKVYAPFGTGVLMMRKGLTNFKASELEQINTYGEENSGGIAALGKALLLLQRIGWNLILEEEQALTRQALNGMAKIEGLRVYGINDPDSPMFSRKGGVIVFGIKGIMSGRVAKELAERGGIGVRYGCHCAHILIKHLLGVPHQLEKVQGIIVNLFPGIRLPGVVRVSLGIGNNEEDVDTLIEVLGKIAAKTATLADRTPVTDNPVIKNLSKAEIKRQLKDFIEAASTKVYSMQ